jgi:hypothetical protein
VKRIDGSNGLHSLGTVENWRQNRHQLLDAREPRKAKYLPGLLNHGARDRIRERAPPASASRAQLGREPEAYPRRDPHVGKQMLGLISLSFSPEAVISGRIGQ